MRRALSAVILAIILTPFSSSAWAGIYPRLNPPSTGLPISGGSVSGNILPGTDATYNLGSSSFRWANGYFSSSVFVGTTGNGFLLQNSSSQLQLRNFANSAYINFFALQIVATGGTRGIVTQGNASMAVGPGAAYCWSDNTSANIGTITACDYAGTGTPEGAVTAAIGSTYHRLDGGAVTSFYVKESGTGNTGWVAK